MYKVAGITAGSLLFLRSMTVIPAVAGQTIEFEQLLRGFGPAVGIAVIELRSGGFAVVGYAENRGAGHLDAWLIRLDPQGDTLWTRRYGDRETIGGGMFERVRTVAFSWQVLPTEQRAVTRMLGFSGPIRLAN